MKKLLALVAFLLLATPSWAAFGECGFGDCGSGGGGTISDAAYGASWNGDTTAGASKNALYDKIETIVAGGLDFALDSSTSGNIVYVGCSDDIQTAITAASAGDTLMLGSCTYTVGTQITVGKALKIVGQGSGNTIITSGATSLTSIFTTTADGLQIKGVSFRGTNLQFVVIIDLSGGTSSSGNNNIFDDIDIDTSKATDVNSGIELLDTGAIVRNSVIKTSTGDYVASQSYGIQCDVASTADVAMELIVMDTVIENISTDSGGVDTNIIRGIRFYDVVSGNPNQMDLYLYNVSIKIRDDASNAIEALHVQGDEMTAYVYNSTLDGYGKSTAERNNKNKDIRCDDGAVCYLSNTVLAGTFYQESAGTINLEGTLLGQNILLDQAPTMRNSGADGVAANPLISGIGGQGGRAAGTGSRSGGSGAAVILTGGVGAEAVNATVTGTGGSGGRFTLTGGAGAAQTAATATTNVGGSGARMEIYAGDGGAASGAATTNTGGAGGHIYLKPGAGGVGTTTTGNDGNIYMMINQGGTRNVGQVAIGTLTPYVDSSLEVSRDGSGGVNKGGYITLSDYDTSASSGDVIGKILFWNNDTQLTTQNLYGSIEVQASAAISTDAAQGKMLFKLTGSTAGSSPATRFTIDPVYGSYTATPSTQTIAAGNTVTADACGGIKFITAAGAVTTDTTNTFTVPASGFSGCIMHVCNSGANDITLDNNSNFRSAGAANVVLTQYDCVIVGTSNATWFQMAPVSVN